MITAIAKVLQKSVEESLEDRIAVSFSGGIDSSAIAFLAKKSANVELFCCGLEGCEDMEYATKVAAELSLPLHKITLQENQIIDIYGTAYGIAPGDLLKTELLVPVYKVLEVAKENGHECVLFGSGSEELFVGYDRYYRYLEEGKDLDTILKNDFKELQNREIALIKKVARKIGIEARFPFYNKKLADIVYRIPLEERIADRERKKGILREVCRVIGLPEIVLQRKKRAMQYGSGVHKVLLKNSKLINARFPSLIPQMMKP